MNVLDVVFQYFEHRIPPSSPNPEEDVYNMRYRNRYFSLFPEDLNKDYNPYDFIEEPVEPRSFRKILTGLIGWTVIIPFILFLLLYQKNIETLSSLVVDRQSLSTLVIKTKLDSADGELHNRAIKAINEYLRRFGKGIVELVKESAGIHAESAIGGMLPVLFAGVFCLGLVFRLKLRPGIKLVLERIGQTFGKEVGAVILVFVVDSGPFHDVDPFRG